MMAVFVNSIPDPDARRIDLGAAPATQSGAGGQWANAWSRTGVTVQHKANLASPTESWSAMKYTDLLPTSLAGGDVFAGDLGVSGQSAATTAVKQEIDGAEGLRFVLAEAASAVSIGLSSFFAGDDRTAYDEGARIRLFDAAGVLVGESFIKASSVSGTQLVQLGSTIPFHSVEISAGALRADGSFSYGGYLNSNGSFGSDIYADSSKAKHGSDFLLDAVSFQIARPVARDDVASLNEDAGLLHFPSVLVNDSAPDAAALSAVLVAGPAHGTLTLDANGSFSYRPDADYHGGDSFTYRAFNGKDYSAPATVQLNIAPVNDAPLAANDRLVTDEDTAVRGNVLSGINGGRDTDVDGDVLVVTTTGTLTTTLGAIVTMGQNGDFTYDPRTASTLQALAAGSSLVDGFDYTVSDGHGGTSTAHVQVQVNGLAEAGPLQPVLTPQVDADVSLTYYLNYVNAKGESKWIAAGALQLDVESSGGTHNGTGSGKASFSDLGAAFGSSDAAVELMQALVQDKYMQQVSVEAYRSGPDGAERLVQRYTLEEARVTSLQTDDDGTSTSNSVSFEFGHFRQSTPVYDSNGRVTRTAEVSWDVAGNMSDLGAGPAALVHGDTNAVAGKTVMAADTALDYYVRLNGSSEWLALSEFSMGFTNGSGKPVAEDVLMGLGNSGVWTDMLTKLLKGSHLESVEIEAYAHGSAIPRLVDEYIFKEVIFTRHESTGMSDNLLGLDFVSFTHGHQNYDAQGVATSWTGTGYDGASGVAIMAPAPVASAAVGGKIATTAQVDADVPLTYYLNYVNAKGESKWIAVGALELDVESSGTTHSGGGAGKASFSDLGAAFGSSDAAVELMQALLQDKTMQRLSVEAYRSGPDGAERLVQRYTLDNTRVTSLQTDDDGTSTSNSISVDFDHFRQSTPVYDSNGRVTRTAEVSWDVLGNTSEAGASQAPGKGGANAIAGQSAMAADTALDYYVRLNGTSGWLALSEFSMGFTNGSGKPVAEDVLMSLGNSGVWTDMLTNVLKGSHLESVEIEAYARGSAIPRLVDEYIFKEVLFTRHESTGMSDNLLGLDFVTFTHGHQNYDAQGRATSWTGTGYDGASAVAIVAPAPVASAAVRGTIATTAQVDADVPLTYYLNYVNAKGESKWIAVGALQLDVESSGGTHNGTGAGKASFSDLGAAFGSSDAAVELMQALVQGKYMPQVSVEAYRSGPDGAERLVQRYMLEEARVTSLQTDDDGASTSNSVSFDFGHFTQSTPVYDSNGRVTRTAEVSWDVEGNMSDLGAGPAALVHGDANAVAGKTVMAADTALDYYVRLNGTSGWLALSEFSMGFTNGSGKPVAEDVLMGLGNSGVWTDMLTKVLKGAHLESVEIEAYAHGSAIPRLVDEYIFKEVLFTRHESTGMNDNLLGLDFVAFTHGHQNYDAQGVATTWTGTGYDGAIGVAIVAPVPHADLPFA